MRFYSRLRKISMIYEVFSKHMTLITNFLLKYLRVNKSFAAAAEDAHSDADDATLSHEEQMTVPKKI